MTGSLSKVLSKLESQQSGAAGVRVDGEDETDTEHVHEEDNEETPATGC